MKEDEQHQLMKLNRAAALYLFLIVGALLYHSLSKPHSFLKEGYWRATLTTAGKKVPFNLEVRGTSSDNAKVFLLTDGRRLEFTKIDQHQDTLLLALEPYHLLIKARIEKQQLTGVATPLDGAKFNGLMDFQAEYGRKHEEESNIRMALNEIGSEGYVAENVEK